METKQELQYKRHEAALKAWETIRKDRILKIKEEYESIDDYIFNPDAKSITYGSYIINPPLIKPSKLTWVEKGGVGKELSDGWALNFAVGCTHACRFCYVDNIHKRYGVKRVGKIVNRAWGNYFLIPSNIDEAIEKTDWKKWKGIEVMMSSTHDPYLPQLLNITRKIVKVALENGVKLCVQTRSPLVKKDFDIYEKYPDQVRIQISVSTMNKKLARLIEPRVSPPKARLNIIKEAKERGLKAGIIIAPVFPPVSVRPDLVEDFDSLISELSRLNPDYIYGEALHIRGSNIIEVESVLNEKINLSGFDIKAERIFYSTLKKYGLKGKWWKEKNSK